MYIVDATVARPFPRPVRGIPARPAAARRVGAAKATRVEISCDARERVRRDAVETEGTTEENTPRGRVPAGAAEDSAVQGGPRFMPVRPIIERMLARRWS